MTPKPTDSPLFDIARQPKAKRKPPAASTPAARIIARWCDLYQAAYGKRGALPGREKGAAKRLADLYGEAAVLRLLPAYFALRDRYIASEGYPLSLLESRWGRLTSADLADKSRVPDAEQTSDYLRKLKER
jgi:hypothetical protein